MKPEFVITPLMLGWCVYVWKKSNTYGEDVVMYVGMSEVGVRRFASHHVLPREFTDDDYIEIYPCACKDTARNLEATFIEQLKPKCNQKTRLGLPYKRNPIRSVNSRFVAKKVVER